MNTDELKSLVFERADGAVSQVIEGAGSLQELGGPVVSILILLSTFAATVIIAKTLQFTFLRVGRKLDPTPVLSVWERDRGRDACMGADRKRGMTFKLLSRAMGALLDGRDKAAVREDIERQAINYISSLRSWFRLLDTIAYVAPLLGLFGTVLGMIEAFRKLQEAGSQVDPGALAGGIWIALLTTAVGLGVAMPVSMALAWLESRVQREQRTLENALTALFTQRATERSFDERLPSKVVEEHLSAA